jgi:large subunit ribosomal protein L15e
MGLYKQMKETIQSEYKERAPLYKQRVIKWNSEPPIVRIAKPTNIARARELGYKAKEGIIVARVRVKRGSSKREINAGGRKPSKAGRFFTRAKSLQAIAEERAGRRFANCEVLSSYFAASSGTDKYFEIVMIDGERPAIASDPEYSRIFAQRNRAMRGLTSSGRKHRGISNKGFGTYVNRPSTRSNIRRQYK